MPRPLPSDILQPALEWSSCLRQALEARPERADQLRVDALTPVDGQRILDWLGNHGIAAHAPPVPVDVCRRALRQVRQRVFDTLMVRDLAGLAPLEEVVQAMSDLADQTVAASYRTIATELADIHGIPCTADGEPQEMIILGMGKLGGRELNVSSDIDLIMLYGDEGETRGRRPISHHEFYAKLTRRMMPVISEYDADGSVFRTDLRLRPDGDSGPLAWSLDALETYLVTQGREWERYAWLKARWLPARAFAGSRPESQVEQMEALRRPFVYRKYFDFDAIAALRALRERIRDDWNRRSWGPTRPDPRQADNVKLGEGGIREIEFIVQLSQLVRGGRMPALQTANLLEALAAQKQAGLIPEPQAQRLEAAYRFLRRVEHALQYRESQQTHLLPHQPQDREALAQALGLADARAFEEVLNEHRHFVSGMFHDVFRLAGLQSGSNGANNSTQGGGNGNNGSTSGQISRSTPGDSSGNANGNSDTECSSPQEALNASVHQHFPETPDDILRRLDNLLNSPRIRGLPDSSRARLDVLLPAVVSAASTTRTPTLALQRLLDLIETVAQRRVYLSLLSEYPQTLARVARMMATSEWVAQFLMRNPLLLDSLIDWRALMEPLDLPGMAKQLAADLDRCLLPDGKPDVERQMNLMRDLQRQMSFHVLAQDLESHLTVEQVGDKLSLLADILLEQTLQRVWPQVAKGRSDPPRFAVIAYGKLGGKELGYDSDLDLVFLFDDDDQTETYVRYARRIVSWLNSMTSSGRLYEVDLRLRPDGDAGLVAASIEAFSRYQSENAWTWEHQALTRARFAAGDAELGARFEAIREAVLLRERDPQALAADVIAMRDRISVGHPNNTALFDLKHDRGGMVDVEFITQYLVLLHARNHPELLGNLGNIALLRLAGEAGLIPLDLGVAVGNAYRSLRREQHALRLQGAEKARVEPAAMAAERAVVCELWQHVLGPFTHAAHAVQTV